MLKKIDEREREIKEVMSNEERLKYEYESKIEGIDSDIETKEEEIEQLRKEKEVLEKEVKTKIIDIWSAIGLSLNLFRILAPTPPEVITTVGPEYQVKARKVTLQELVDVGLVRNGQVLYFSHHGKVFRDEQAEIVANQNKLKYKSNGKLYSISELAKEIDIKVGLKHDDHGVAGPSYWQTEDGKLLHNLNEIVRRRH